MIVTLSLEDSRHPSDPYYLGSLALTHANGFVTQQVSLGLPEIRQSYRMRPRANGTDDVTAYYGPRTIGISLGLDPDNAGVNDEMDLLATLGRWMDPAVRAWLVINGTRRALVRPAALDAGLDTENLTFQKIGVAWVAPNGVLESVSLLTQDSLFAASAYAGRSYSRLGNRSYPAPTAGGIGTLAIVNEGSIPVFPTITIFGAAVNPRMENMTTGEVFEFDGLTLTTADTLVVDFMERTVTQNGVAGTYANIDFVTSLWWSLRPGLNNIRFSADSAAATTYARIEWRHGWMF